MAKKRVELTWSKNWIDRGARGDGARARATFEEKHKKDIARIDTAERRYLSCPSEQRSAAVSIMRTFHLDHLKWKDEVDFVYKALARMAKGVVVSAMRPCGPKHKDGSPCCTPREKRFWVPDPIPPLEYHLVPRTRRRRRSSQA